MAWWDYGYQINGLTNRTTLADGNTWNHEHIALIGRCLTGPERQAHEAPNSMTGGEGDHRATGHWSFFGEVPFLKGRGSVQMCSRQWNDIWPELSLAPPETRYHDIWNQGLGWLFGLQFESDNRIPVNLNQVFTSVYSLCV